MKVGPGPLNLPPRTPQSQAFSLRPGQTLRLFVESRQGETAVVRVGTHRLTARFQGDARAGHWYRVQVVRNTPTTVLRVLHNTAQDISSLVRSYAPPGDNVDAVVRAFIRSSLALHGERLQLALRRVNSSDRLSVPERARLAAVLEGKGLLDSETVWERAIQTLSGSAGEGRGGHGERGRGGREEGRDPADSSESQETDDDTTPVLPESIRRAFTSEREATDALQLVNHTRDKGDQWIVVPLEFEGADDFSAAIKMRLPGSTTSPASFREAVLDVRDGERRWTFALLPTETAVRVVALEAPGTGDPGDDSGRLFASLRSRLEAIGIDFDHRPMSKDSNDGFSSEDGPTIMQGVDQEA